jgi:serine/threonine protein kinase
MGGSCSIVPTSSSPYGLFSSSPQSLSLFREFKIRSVIGKGGFATVYHARGRYFKDYAMKRIQFLASSGAHIIDKDLTMAFTELKILKRLDEDQHPHITKLHKAFSHRSCCYLILDYHSGGDLRHHLKTFRYFSEQQVAYYIACLGSALTHLHRRGILHRDIKPDNVLLTAAGQPKLTDFGASYLEAEYTLPVCDLDTGTLPYMAPETLTNSRCHSYQSDYWSLGIMAFELLFNCVPFSSHCPVRFIYYVGNQYQCLWDKLLLIESMEHSRRGVYWCAQTDGSPNAPFHDFNELNESITPQQRVESYPFPEKNHLFDQPSSGPLLCDAYILESLSLTISIPRYTSQGIPISFECLNFLNSILDIRIPHRLGQLSEFDKFSNHLWFQRFHYHCDGTSGSTARMSAIVSPYQPTLPAVCDSLKQRFKNDLISPNLELGDCLPTDVQSRLEGFQYQSLPPPSLWSPRLAKRYRTSNIIEATEETPFLLPNPF